MMHVSVRWKCRQPNEMRLVHIPHPISFQLPNRSKGKRKRRLFLALGGFLTPALQVGPALKTSTKLRLTGTPKETCNRVTLNSVAGHRSRQGNKWISVEWFWFGESILSNIIPRVHSKQRQPHDSFGIISATCHSICAREANWLREVCQKHSSSDLPWSSNILQVF